MLNCRDFDEILKCELAACCAVIVRVWCCL